MASKRFIDVICFLCIGLISGCGGSGGEDELQFSDVGYAQYHGATSSSEIDTSNAKKFAHYVTQSIDFAEFFHAFIGVEKTYGERLYVLTGGNFQDESSDEDLCSDGGDFNLVEQLNDKGEGRFTYVFDQCEDGPILLDGSVILDARRSGDGFSVKVRIGELRMRSRELPSNELEFVVSGEIESLLNEYGFYRDNTQWTANLVIADDAEDIQFTVKDLTRADPNGYPNNDYSIDGKLFISDEGGIDVDFDTLEQTLSLLGKDSSLIINYDINEDGSDGYYFPVETFAIQLISSRESIPTQTITLSPEQLIEQYFRNVQAPQFTWSDPLDVTKGQDVLIEPEVVESDSFLQYDWSLESATNQCDVDAESDGIRFNVTSECYGDVVARLRVFDGFSAYSHDYAFRFKKAPPQVIFESFDGVADPASTFSLNSTIANAAEGPFQYRIAYGLPGSSISESGVFNWALDSDFPNLFSEMELHYGVSVRNDDTIVKDLKVTVDFKEVTPSELIPYVPVPGEVNYTRYAGGFDLEPENPNGDIAFIAINFEAKKLVKLNKSTKQLRVIGDIPGLEGVSSNSEFDKRTRFIDWNEDGAEDLVYSRSHDNGQNVLTELFVFDVKAESVLLQLPLLTTSYIYQPVYPELTDFQIKDLNSDGVRDLVFEVSEVFVSPTSVTASLVDSAVLTNGIVMFDMRERTLHQLLEDSYSRITESFLVDDFDKNGIIELLMFDIAWNELYLYRFDPTTYELTLARKRSVRDDVGLVRDYRNLLFFESRDVDGDNQQEVTLLFGTNNLRCLRFVETGDDRPECLSSHVIYDAQLNLVMSNPLNIISGHVAPIRSSSSDSSELLMMHAQDLVLGGTRVIAFDPFVGEIVWSSLSDDPNLFIPLAASKFIDSSGKQQLAVGQIYGIVVTQ